jgi:inorganic pyrophosphatase
MSFKDIPALADGCINVVIETPARTQSKYVYEKQLGIFKLKKVLPMGMVFPFSFGFIPNTLGGDGDPLDVLVIMDEPGWPGCLVTCRLLGVLQAVQKSGEGEVRNDRLIAVSEVTTLYQGIEQITGLNKSMVAQIESFFIEYNRQEGKTFIPGQWKDKKAAMKAVERAIILE